MNTNDIRELTADETNSVSGGNPIVAFFVGYVATKVLDGLSEPSKEPGWLEKTAKYINDKRGKPQ
jgi:hypothetical protein